MKKSKRTVIAKDTLEILKNGWYTNQQGKTISISKAQKEALRNTHLYTPDELLLLLDEQYPSSDQPTTFLDNNLTTLDSVRQEFRQDEQLVCLNFASARNPGGGFLKGSQAQEESIARASGLYPCQLKAEKYYLANRKIDTCLYTDNMIYSPAVPILKDEEGELMDEAIFTSIITAPAVNTGVVLRNEPHNIDKIEPYMQRRVDMVLAICKKHQHQTLILGAWGCGVFRNDPEVVANIFKEKLTGKYKNQFKKVVFSIYSKEEKYITPFQQAFNS